MNAELRQRMTTPVLVTAGLLLGLAINVTIATLMTFQGRGYVGRHGCGAGTGETRAHLQGRIFDLGQRRYRQEQVADRPYHYEGCRH